MISIIDLFINSLSLKNNSTSLVLNPCISHRSSIICLISKSYLTFIIFINVVLGSIWWAIIYNLDAEAIKTYVLLTTLPKNVLYLLPQSILLYILLRALAKPLAKFGLINNKIAENVELF